MLVLRTRPCRPTADGEVLVRLAGRWAARPRRDEPAVPVPGSRPSGCGDRGGSRSPSTTTRCPRGSPPRSRTCPPDVLLDLRREDQELSADLLRDGTVMAAVTADPGRCRAVGSAASEPCGTWPWRPGARGRRFARRARRRGVRRGAPAGVQPRGRPAGTLRGVRSSGGARSPRTCTTCRRSPRSSGSWRPGSAGEWCPRSRRSSGSRRRTLVEIRAGRNLDVPLYWQHWALRTPTLDDLTERVVRAAAAALRPVRRTGPRRPADAF